MTKPSHTWSARIREQLSIDGTWTDNRASEGPLRDLFASHDAVRLAPTNITIAVEMFARGPH